MFRYALRSTVFIVVVLAALQQLIVSPGLGADVPYVFGDDGARPMEDRSLYLTDPEALYEVDEDTATDDGYPADSPSGTASGSASGSTSGFISVPLSTEDTGSEIPLLAEFSDSDVIEFTTASGPAESRQTSKSRTVGAIKEEINDKVDVDNEITRNTAVVIAAKYPGEYNVDQICSVHEYLKGGWQYVADPRGVDYYSSASNTLELGKEVGCVGVGDCDDFAILMSAMIESIGGTTRVILAYDKSSGHAYTEVYLGKMDDTGQHVEEMVNWLKSKYNTKNIYTHVDPKSKEVWLNLDWSADHPGGPFWKADKHKPLLVREQYGKVPPGLPEGYVGTAAARSSQTTSAIQGRVTDEAGNPLISRIVLTDRQGRTQLAVTDHDGYYEISLDPGSYELTAEKDGYYFEEMTVNIRPDRDVVVPIRGQADYVIDTGVTLGAAYSWGDDESLVDYYG